MTIILQQKGLEVNRKRVQAYMRKMGIEAIYPKSKKLTSNAQHVKYPYLLSQVPIVENDQVWSTDITYIPMPYRFMYLVAVIDWYSRYVLSWELSESLETSFYIKALLKAFTEGNKNPEIFNTDQGSQFTSLDYIDCLKDKQIKISMDGKGRAIDNVFIERLWRSLKYEEIYVYNHESIEDLTHGVKKYFDFYNNQRPYQSLQNHTPYEVYRKKLNIGVFSRAYKR